MKLTAPAYYPAFSCIAGDCRHSCCIGWEIDIDEETVPQYRRQTGEIGERMRACIDFDSEPPHFILQGEEERCPFLNRRGLCDIILTCGEGALCQICRDHPRYRNFFSDVTEIGVGMCCEAAAALILGYEKPLSMIVLSDDGEASAQNDEEEAYFALRDALFALLQDRSRSLDARIDDMLFHVGADRCTDIPAWGAFCSQLEILDPAWKARLDGVSDKRADLCGHAGEQLLVYLLMRHLPKILEGEDPAVIAAFSVLAYDLIASLFANTDGSFDSLCDIARMFSSEIEYSEENLYAIFDEIACS
ncbi:MAG: flagellin lysine-N-methylase [Clostridia bacterium]|nr:flagellin lysine-N-methylase [Clostridia bacterium]